MPFDWTLIPTIIRGLATAANLAENVAGSKDGDRRIPRLADEVGLVRAKLEALAETFTDLAEEIRGHEEESEARFARIQNQQASTAKQLAEFQESLSKLQSLTTLLLRVVIVLAVVVGSLTFYVLLQLFHVVR